MRLVFSYRRSVLIYIYHCVFVTFVFSCCAAAVQDVIDRRVQMLGYSEWNATLNELLYSLVEKNPTRRAHTCALKYRRSASDLQVCQEVTLRDTPRPG